MEQEAVCPVNTASSLSLYILHVLTIEVLMKLKVTALRTHLQQFPYHI